MLAFVLSLSMCVRVNAFASHPASFAALLLWLLIIRTGPRVDGWDDVYLVHIVEMIPSVEGEEKNIIFCKVMCRALQVDGRVMCARLV
jgi:hypothetical protein